MLYMFDTTLWTKHGDTLLTKETRSLVIQQALDIIAVYHATVGVAELS